MYDSPGKSSLVVFVIVIASGTADKTSGTADNWVPVNHCALQAAAVPIVDRWQSLQNLSSHELFLYKTCTSQDIVGISEASILHIYTAARNKKEI